jgi:hypothetical protein
MVFIYSITSLHLLGLNDKYAGDRIMSSKDLKIKMEIDKILQNSSAGIKLKAYFENMPDKSIRRAIHILAAIYPDKRTIPDDDFMFISFMLSNKRIITLAQERFSDFIRSLNLIDFTENQKNMLINLIKEHIETLCEACMFELDDLLIRIFDRTDLFKYLETLADGGNTAVLRRIADILRYEDFSGINASDEKLKRLVGL